MINNASLTNCFLCTILYCMERVGVTPSQISFNKQNYYVVRDAGCLRSRNTLKLTPFLINQSINYSSFSDIHVLKYPFCNVTPEADLSQAIILGGSSIVAPNKMAF